MAEVKSENPVGTLEELRKQRMSPAQYGSCSAPVVVDGERTSIGCKHHVERDGVFVCQFVPGGSVPEMWQNVCGKGPEIVPVRIVLDSGSSVERPLPCFSYMDKHEEWNEIPDSGGNVEVIPSKKYLYRGTRPKTIMENGKQITTHEDVVEEKEVEPFDRPGTNPAHIGTSYSSEIKKRAAAERREKARDKRLGLTKEDDKEPE